MVALIKEKSEGQHLRFTTPAFDGLEERIGEGTWEFDIRGNHNDGKDLKRPGVISIIYTQLSSRMKKD